MTNQRAAILPVGITITERASSSGGAPAPRIDPAKGSVHGSVCRDHLEPATASGVHHGLDLPAACMVYDVSNACLGLLNGVVQVANMIELGQIRAGLVVGTESGRGLVETTIDQLNRDTSLSRRDIKLAFASLTIGSGSAAILLTDREVSRTGNRLLGGAVRTATDFCNLCQSGRDESGGDRMQPLMWTDAERLMHEGVAAAKETFADFLAEINWDAAEIDKTFCHQVGRAHQKLLFERWARSGDRLSDDPPAGNTGSVALPTAAAIGIEQATSAHRPRRLAGNGSHQR